MVAVCYCSPVFLFGGDVTEKKSLNLVCGNGLEVIGKRSFDLSPNMLSCFVFLVVNC